MLISSVFFENHVIPSVMLLRDEHKNPPEYLLLVDGLSDTFCFISVNSHKMFIYGNYKRKPYIISLQVKSMEPILHRIERKNSIYCQFCAIFVHF